MPRKPNGTARNTSSKVPQKLQSDTMIATCSEEGPARIAQIFGTQTIMNRPAYMHSAEWLDHVPFGFWLMETLAPKTFVEIGTTSGSSYFAFCQVAERLTLDTRCYAFGVWPSVGTNSASDLQRLRSYNGAHYSAFSSILNEQPENAVQHFQTGSIDLLHITKTSSYQALSDIFEAWLPKLSKQGIIALHGTNIQAGKAGVSRFVADLRETYPTFEFRHGDGLMVIGAGGEPNESLVRLFEARDNSASRSALNTIFARLGRGCLDAHAAMEFEQLYQKAQADIASMRLQLDQSLGKPKPQISQHFANTEQTAPELLNLRQELKASKAEITKLRHENADSQKRLKERGQVISEQKGKMKQLAEKAGKVDHLEKKYKESQTSLEARFSELAALTSRLCIAEQDISDQDSLKQEVRNLRAALTQQEKEYTELQQNLRDLEQTIQELHELRKEDITARESWEIACQEMLNSTSWKATQPLRLAMNTLRRSQ